jgi:hypothetical protein
LVATLLLDTATISPWIAAVFELGNSLFVPVFNTILQQLPNKQAFVPLST